MGKFLLKKLNKDEIAMLNEISKYIACGIECWDACVSMGVKFNLPKSSAGCWLAGILPSQRRGIMHRILKENTQMERNNIEYIMNK
jgi:hypothetical protein